MNLDRILAETALFAPLGPEERADLASVFIRRAFDRGEILFRQGEPGRHLYLVESGKIKITVPSTDGREALLVILDSGEIFGELSLFDEGVRTADARAMDPVVVHVLPHDIFRKYVEGHPRVAWELLKILAVRVRETDEAMQDVIFFDVPGRVAKRLLDLAERNGVPDPDGTRIDVPLTQEEIAQMVGSSRESVNKALASFSERGWIVLRDRQYVITNAESLRARIN